MSPYVCRGCGADVPFYLVERHMRECKLPPKPDPVVDWEAAFKYLARAIYIVQLRATEEELNAFIERYRKAFTK